jgi:diguanylate cyclase
MLEAANTTNTNEPIEGFMVRGTAWLLGSLVLIEIATWIIMLRIGEIGAFDLWLLPAFALVFAIMFVLLRQQPQRVNLIQRIMLGLIGCYELIDLISSGLPEVQSQNAIGVGMVWFPGTIVTAFVILRHNLATRLSVMYMLIALGLGIFFFRDGINAAQFNALLQFYASNLAILGVSSVFGYMRNQYLNLRSMAYTDTLTGIINRRAMLEHLETARSNNAPFSVLMIDIDEFKRVNDTHGHPVGDQVLREMALVLEGHTRTSDRIARWGGEEFLILAIGSNITQSQQLAGRLLEAVQAANVGGLGLTVSIGVSEFRAGSTIESVISMADVALYQAKAAGKNRSEIAQRATRET